MTIQFSSFGTSVDVRITKKDQKDVVSELDSHFVITKLFTIVTWLTSRYADCSGSYEIT